MRFLKRRILAANGFSREGGKLANLGIANISGRFSKHMLRSSLPKKKQRELGMRPSVEGEIWQKEQERKHRKEKGKKQSENKTTAIQTAQASQV